MNLMTDTFIDRVDLFGKYQEALFLFTDCKGWLVGYGDV